MVVNRKKLEEAFESLNYLPLHEYMWEECDYNSVNRAHHILNEILETSRKESKKKRLETLKAAANSV